jgi:hypothetical protein
VGSRNSEHYPGDRDCLQHRVRRTGSSEACWRDHANREARWRSWSWNNSEAGWIRSAGNEAEAVTKYFSKTAAFERPFFYVVRTPRKSSHLRGFLFFSGTRTYFHLRCLFRVEVGADDGHL